MSNYGKLIGSVLGSGLSWAVLHFGLDMDPVLQASIVTAVSGFLVWLIPNNP